MRKLKANWFKRVLMEVAPGMARRRVEEKLLCRAYYSAAETGRRKDGWTTTNGTAEQLNRGDRDRIRARARDLERNDDLYKGIIKDLERNVVSRGIILQANVSGQDGEEDDAINNAIEKAWKIWSRPENCTVNGMLSLCEVQRMAVRRRFVDGGLLILKVVRDGRLRLQLLEVDDLDTTITGYQGRRVVGGIEIDGYARPVAYHIRKLDVFGYYSGEAIRVPADRVIYLSCQDRVSQVREISPSASSLARVDDIGQLMEAAIKKEQVQACFSVAITSETPAGVGLGRSISPSGGYGNGHNDAVYPDETLYPGMIKHLAPGESITSINPAGQSTTADGLIRSIQRQAGAGAGLSYEAVSRDLSQTNYSSGRMGQLQDRRTYGEWQQYLIDHFLQPIFCEWLQLEVLGGRLILPDYWTEPDRYESVRWVPPGWDWIDPLKEANANKIALETAQTTLQKICASRGEDYRDVLAQWQREKKQLAEFAAENTPKEEI